MREPLVASAGRRARPPLEYSHEGLSLELAPTLPLGGATRAPQQWGVRLKELGL